MSRRLILLTLATILVAGLISAGAGAGRSQTAARSFSVGIYDDSMTLGNPDKGFPLMRKLRVQVVRVTLWWRGVATKRPANATDPADPAYNWFGYDRAVQDAAKYRIKILFSIVGTPGWANGGSKPFIFPWISLPQLSLRVKPIKQLQTRADVGFSLTGFFFGLSAIGL